MAAVKPTNDVPHTMSVRVLGEVRASRDFVVVDDAGNVTEYEETMAHGSTCTVQRKQTIAKKKSLKPQASDLGASGNVMQVANSKDGHTPRSKGVGKDAKHRREKY